MAPFKPNGYFFYMQHQRKNHPGWRNKSNAELSHLCSSGWNSLSAVEKGKFDAMKDGWKEKGLNGQERKKGEVRVDRGVDGIGRPLSELAARDKNEILSKNADTKFVENLVMEASKDGKIPSTSFFFIHVNDFGLTRDDPPVYIPAELACIKFSLEQGVNECVHFFIHPRIPVGYKFLCQTVSQNTHCIPISDFSENYTEDELIKETLQLFVKDGGNNTAVFTLPELKAKTEQVLERIFSDNIECIKMRILDAGILLADIFNTDSSDSLKMNSSDAVLHLKDKMLSYSPHANCDWHENNSETPYCSMAIAKQWCSTFSRMLDNKYKIPSRKSDQIGAKDDVDDWGDDEETDLGFTASYTTSNYASDGFSCRDIRLAKSVEELKLK